MNDKDNIGGVACPKCGNVRRVEEDRSVGACEQCGDPARRLNDKGEVE